MVNKGNYGLVAFEISFDGKVKLSDEYRITTTSKEMRLKMQHVLIEVIPEVMNYMEFLIKKKKIFESEGKEVG